MQNRQVDKLMGKARQRRPAYILIVVLGLTTVVATLGIAFLEANSTAMPEAHNRYRASRAQYLAESGVDIAMHYLMYAPTTVSAGNYWTGENGIAVDGSSDYCDVAVAQVSGDLFRIGSIGVARDFSNSVRGRRSIEAAVLLPPDVYWEISTALSGNLTGLPADASISPSGSKCDTALGDTCALPSADVAAHYTRYSHGHRMYVSNLVNRATLTSANAGQLNALDMSATNPGRVMYTPGNLTITEDLSLSGTLAVNGDLALNPGVQMRISAVSGYPALVVAGDIKLGALLLNRTELRVTGAVVCGGVVRGPDLSVVSDLRLEVEGPLVVRSGFHNSLLNILGSRDFRFEYDSSRAKFKNFESRLPITILSWREN